MKTAVEKLEMKIVELEKDYAIPHRVYELCEEAKIDEKQQIIRARKDIYVNGNLSAEQYYIERFKKESKL